MKKKNRDGTGIPFTFYVPANKKYVVKDFDHLVERLKGSNRSQELVFFMERYIEKYNPTKEEVEEPTEENIEEEAEEEVEDEEEETD